LGAFTPSERQRHKALTTQLMAGVAERREMADGFAFRVQGVNAADVAEWAALERRCCPFFQIDIQGRGPGPVWLRLTGPEGVKEFITAEFS
jgi:hypothetical protein